MKNIVIHFLNLLKSHNFNSILSKCKNNTNELISIFQLKQTYHLSIIFLKLNLIFNLIIIFQ